MTSVTQDIHDTLHRCKNYARNLTPKNLPESVVKNAPIMAQPMLAGLAFEMDQYMKVCERARNAALNGDMEALMQYMAYLHSEIKQAATSMDSYVEDYMPETYKELMDKCSGHIIEAAKISLEREGIDPDSEEGKTFMEIAEHVAKS